MSQSGRSTLMETPEANVALFALLLNYPWELLQVPFYVNMATAPHWVAISVCTRATLGDVGIALVALWGAAAVVKSRQWIRDPTRTATIVFIAIGVVITTVFERLATGPLRRWTYSELMPVVPVLEVGLAPLAQWLLLPLALVWLVRRQLAGAAGRRQT